MSVFLILTAASGTPARAVQANAVRPGCPDPAPAGDRAVIGICRTMTPVRIDGDLNDRAWQDARPVALSWETYPGDNTDARFSTTCFTAYDDEYLYLACDAEDPDPAHLRAFLTARDQIGGHDRIGFVLDPFDDTRRAFQFVVSALGVQADGVLDQQEGGSGDAWDAIWTSAGRPTATGYAVEAAIPFESLRFPNSTSIQTWRFYIWRERIRSEQIETRSVRFDRGNSCLMCQAGLLTGLQGVSPGRSVQVSPTVTAIRSDRREELSSAHLTRGAVDREAGLDVHWGITPDLSLDATVNPDFSQVEADAAQLDVNNRFALFYPEKRPFFLEGAELFATPLQAVFTRTVADPVFGSKVTGKVGGSALGLVVARDRTSNLLVPGNQGSTTLRVEQEVTSVLGRVRRDVGASSTVGALYTRRQGEGYHNQVLGADGFLRPVPPLTVQLQALRSTTAYPGRLVADAGLPAEPIDGTALLARVNYESRTFRGEAVLRRLSPDFRADAGFITQVDLRSANLWVQRQWFGEPGSRFTRLNLTTGFWRDETVGGRLTQMVNWANVLYMAPGVWRVFLDFQRVREYYEGETYTLYHYRGEVSYEPSGRLRVSLGARAGDAIDLSNARQASWLRVVPSIEMRLGRHLHLAASESVERLRHEGEHVVTAHVPQLQATYNVSPSAFVRFIGQYGLTTRTPASYIDEVNARDRKLFTQALFSYEVNPQTAVFVGYEDTRRGVVDAAGQTIPLVMSGRTFFLKLGYAWRP